MEFYDAVERRKTTKEFLKKDVDFAAVRRILEAGNRAPTWDHNRNWRYILLRTDEEKEYAFAEAKKIADKFDAERYLHMPRPYPITGTIYRREKAFRPAESLFLPYAKYYA